MPSRSDGSLGGCPVVARKQRKARSALLLGFTVLYSTVAPSAPRISGCRKVTLEAAQLCDYVQSLHFDTESGVKTSTYLSI